MPDESYTHSATAYHVYYEYSDDQRYAEFVQARRGSDSSYSHMLMEDVGHILPFGRGLDDGFDAELVPLEDGVDLAAVRPLVCGGLSQHYERTSLSEAVSDFLQSCVPITLFEQFAVYEIDYLRETDTAAQPVGFRLLLLPPPTVERRRRGIVQYVPKDRATRVESGIGVQTLDPKALAVFELSDQLERRVRPAINYVAVASEERSEMDLVLRSPPGYDYTEHTRLTRELFLRETSPIGWAGRGLHDEFMLDPYKVWRRLQFARLQVELREELIAQLNATLGRVAAAIGFGPVEIHLHRVTTSADVDAAEADLRDGRRALLELRRRF